MPDNLADLVAALRAQHRTMARIAALVGMSESGFVRGVKRGTLSIENLLDFARAADLPAARVLRAAGKGAIADRLDALYGIAEETPSEREVRTLFASLSDPSSREAVLVLLRALAAAWSADSARLPGTPRSPGGSRAGRRRAGRGARRSPRAPLLDDQPDPPG